MKKALFRELESLRIIQQQASGPLTIFPITADWSHTKDYLTLDEALEENLLEIRELDREGSVPELLAVTKSDIPVILFAGQELIGAKQNRMLNTTVLLPPNSKTVIDVSCVEQGRWSFKSEQFESGGMVMRSLKENVVRESAEFLRREGRARSNQSMVWDRIAERASHLNVESPTDAQREIFEQKSQSIKEHKKAFSTVQKQVGLIVLFNEKVAGLEVFPDSETFKDLFDPLLESYIVDALDLEPVEIDKPAKEKKATRFFNKIFEARIESFSSVGLGNDVRLSSGELTGSALMYRERIYHLACFPMETRKRKSRFGSYGRRTMII